MWNKEKMCSTLLVVVLLASLESTPSMASYFPVPGASMIYQKVLYNIQTSEGAFLDMDPQEKDLFGKALPTAVAYRYRQELASETSFNFLFITRGGTHPGLAGISFTENEEMYRFLVKDNTSTPETIKGNTGTIFKPSLYCAISGIIESFIGCTAYNRFSLLQVSLGEDPLYLIGISDGENLADRKFLGKQVHPNDTNNAGEEKRYIPSIVEESEALKFRFIPVTDRVALSVIHFNYDGNITDKANDVKMATDEVIINNANAVVEHIYSKTITLTSSMRTEENWSHRVSVNTTLEKEASAGFFDFVSVKSKTVIEGHFNWVKGGKKETVIETEEEFEISQSVIIQPFKAVRCQSWVKVVKGAEMPYTSEAIVRMYWKELDPHSGELVVKAMPPQIVLALIPYYVKGWQILKATETGVLVEIKGSMTVNFGVSAFFSSENIDDPGLLARFEREKPKGMFAAVDKTKFRKKNEL